MQRLIRVLTIILFILCSLSTWVPAKTLCSDKLSNQKYSLLLQSQSTNFFLTERKEQSPKFKIGITGRSLSGKYSLALTVEPPQRESLLAPGKIKIGSKSKVPLKIILYIPRKMEDREEEAILTSSDRKTSITGRASASSTFQTTVSGNMPAKGELVVKDRAGKILDVIQFQVLDNSKSVSDLAKGEPAVPVQKHEQSQSGNLYLSTEETLLELMVATGEFCNLAITLSNHEDEPIHIRGYLQYIEFPLSTVHLGIGKGDEFSQWVTIELSDFELQPGEEKRVDTSGCILPKEEDQYYARVVLEVDSLSEQQLDIDSDQSVGRELLADYNTFKEKGPRQDKPLEFTIVFRGPKKVQLISYKKRTVKDREALVEQTLLARELEFAFPEGIERIEVVYEKKLPPGSYVTEMRVEQGEKTSISQSHTVSVK